MNKIKKTILGLLGFSLLGGIGVFGTSLLNDSKINVLPNELILKTEKNNIIKEKEVMQEDGSKAIMYEYLDTAIADVEIYKGYVEDINKRKKNQQHFKISDNNWVMKYYGGYDMFAYKDNNWRKIKAGTTTVEAFNEQTKLNLIDKIFGNVMADTDNTSTNNKDAQLSLYYPTTNYGTLNNFLVSGQPSNGSNRHRGVMEWTLPSLSGTISDIVLNLNVRAVGGGATADVNIEVHELTQTFVESEVTWNSYSSGNNWSTAGGDYSATIVYAKAMRTSTTGVWDTFPLQGSGADNTLSLDWEDTFDIILKLSDETVASGCYNGFFTKEYATTASRPYLEITYTTATPAVDKKKLNDFHPGQPF